MWARLLGVGLVVGMAVGAAAAEEVKLDAATKAKIRKLQLERCDALKKTLLGRLQQMRSEPGPIGLTPRFQEVLRVSRRLLKAELDVATKPGERVSAYAFHLETMKWAEKLTEELAKKGGFVAKPDIEWIRAARLKAEVGWLKAGGKDSAKEMRANADSQLDKDLRRAFGTRFAEPGRPSKKSKE